MATHDDISHTLTESQRQADLDAVLRQIDFDMSQLRITLACLEVKFSSMNMTARRIQRQLKGRWYEW